MNMLCDLLRIFFFEIVTRLNTRNRQIIHEKLIEIITTNIFYLNFKVSDRDDMAAKLIQAEHLLTLASPWFSNI